MMDALMLLAKGKIIFFNQANKAVDYFAGINYTCPELSNPSDYFMSIMSIETIEQEVQEQDPGRSDKNTVMELYTQRIQFFSQQYERSGLRNDPGAGG